MSVALAISYVDPEAVRICISLHECLRGSGASRDHSDSAKVLHTAAHSQPVSSHLSSAFVADADAVLVMTCPLEESSIRASHLLLISWRI